MTYSDCKKEAKNKLVSRKLRAFRIFAILSMIAVLSGIAAYSMPHLINMYTQNYVLLFAAQTVLFLLTVGTLGAIHLGKTAWFYCAACGKEPSRLQFKYWFRKGRGLKAAALYLETGIRKTIWSVLLCLPAIALFAGGIGMNEQQSERIRCLIWIGAWISACFGLFFACLIHQKYALAPMLYARNPQKGIRSAIRGSCFLMDESCFFLMKFKLSFVLWMLSCVFILPLVYVMPYYQQATACMLRSILRKHTI